MGNWNEVEFNGPYEGEEIKEINGIVLPEQYLAWQRVTFINN